MYHFIIFIGNGFAIKQPDDTYQYITTDDITINTLPTTLACRTDTYPHTEQIMWEYKPSIGGTWSSITGTWNPTLGISELTVTEDGTYRCIVTTGGNEQLYTAVTPDVTTTTETVSGNKNYNYYHFHIICVHSIR